MSKENEMMETPEVIEESIDVMEPEVYETEPEEGSGIAIGKLVLATALVAGGIGILCHKFKDKIEEHQANKLRKKGYTVIEPDELEFDDIDTESAEDVEDFEEDSEK